MARVEGPLEVEIPHLNQECVTNPLVTSVVAMEAIPHVAGQRLNGTSDFQVQLDTENLDKTGVVEMLSKFDMSKVPDYYVKPLHLRQLEVHPDSGKGGAVACIPVVDFTAPREMLVEEIRKACQYGFFHIINHGTQPDLLQRIERQSLEFFALPAEEKVKSSTDKKVTGPVHFGGGSRGDWRDVLKLQCAPDSEVAVDFWPLQPPGFRDTILEYANRTKVLAREILSIMSESLGLEKGYIEAECGDPRILLAMNFYPPCPDPTKTIGIREHSDPNTITILLQDEVEGLQVYKDGLWINVKPLKGALVINAGDHLQIVSNGRYPSVLHRVVTNKLRSRMSIAAFYSPSSSALIKPARALVDDLNPAMFSDFIYKDYLANFYRNGGPNNKVILSSFKA